MEKSKDGLMGIPACAVLVVCYSTSTGASLFQRDAAEDREGDFPRKSEHIHSGDT
jgi:hypothetical protein